MAVIFDTVSIVGKRKAHFYQLMAYLQSYEDSGCYYGNKKQFDKRHEDIKEWLYSIIERAEDPDFKIPTK